MNEELKQAIFSLCSTMSISGFETRMGTLLRESLGKEFDEFYTDSVGNHILLRRSNRPNAPLVLIDAHFDEIGMMVTEVCQNGFLRLTQIGGVSPCVLQAADVMVYGTKTVRGVIVSTPPHLRSGKEDRLPDAEELMVDTGYSKEEMEKIAPVGTPVGFAPIYGELLNGTLVGKSFDNKACAAIAAYAILHTPREELCADVALLLSSYEETSRIGGVGPATFGLSPDYAMVIDVNLATVPDVPKYETVAMGKGISLSLSAATDCALTRATQKLCDHQGIAHCMIAAPSSTGTNAMTVNLTGGGVPVVDVGLPLRSMHTYNEEISMDDAESLCRLVRAFICGSEIAQEFSADGRKELPV